MERLQEIEQIQKQFLCGTFLKNFVWPTDPLTVEEQQTILAETVNSKLNISHPLKLEYQKHFLKSLMLRLEQQEAEIDDSLFTTFGRVMAPPIADPCPDRSFKHYCGNKSVITLEESVNLISNGTTGLRTWQAAVVMAEWCTQNEQLLKNKKILELGSGVGLTGLAATLECSPHSFIFTDCHPAVLETLCTNVNLNFMDKTCDEYCKKHNDNSTILTELKLKNGTLIKVVDLLWEDTNENICESFGKIDFVFAADVIYDESIFEPLVNTMQLLAIYCEVDNFYFCCTERNKDTLEKFLSLLRNSFKVSEMDVPDQKTYVWPTETPVRLFDIAR